MNNINKNIKAYFLDLDGTLLDERQSKGTWGVSELNKQAIKEAQDNGKHIIISTGRIGQLVRMLMKDLDIKYAVTGNGSIVINQKGKMIKNDPLTVQQFLKVLDIIKKYKLSMKLDGDLEAYGIISSFSKMLSKKFGFVPHNNYNCKMHELHHKIVIWGKSKSKMNKIKELINANVKDLSIESSAKGWTLEITNKLSTKGLGNLAVLNELGIDKKEAVHVGDTMNDSTTAKHMKLIVVKNATKELKSVAQYIGPNWKNGGVAKIINGDFQKIIKK